MNRRTSAGTVFILITIMLDTLGIGLIIPVGPKLVAELVHVDIAQASQRFTVLFSLYSAMQFLFAPILGALSDRFGRRAVILPSLLGGAASYLLSAFSPVLSWLYVGRVIAGITGASFSAATAYIADTTPPEKRAQSFGLVGAAFGLGFVIGPVIGGVLGDVDVRLPYFVAAGLNGVNFLYGVLVLPESLKPEARRPFTFARANPLASLRNLGRHAIVLGLTGTMICGFMAQIILQSIWTTYNRSRFDWSGTAVGISLGVVGVATAVVQGGLIRVIVPRLGEKRVLLLAMAIGAAGHVAFGLASRGVFIYAIILPFALGGLAGPATQSLITREVGPSEQGEIQGSLSSLQSLAAIVGPFIGGALFQHFGVKDAHPYVPGAPFFAAACFNLLGLALAVRLFARAPAAATE